MPGQKISSMTLVNDLQDFDQFPIARNGSTYRIRGMSLASRVQLNALSAKMELDFASGAYTAAISAKVDTLLTTAIVKPQVVSAGQILTYDASTLTWVASANSGALPRGPTVLPYQLLVFDGSTQTWVASSAPPVQESILGDGAPIGAVMHFAASAAPIGWVEAAGQSLNKNTYIDLFNVIGYAFGSEFNGTYFKLPDLRGETIRGWDHGRGIDPDRTFGSFQKGSVAGDTSRVVLSGVPLLSAKNVLGFDSDVGNDYPGLELPPLSSANYNMVIVNEDEPTIAPALSAVIGISRSRNLALLPCIKYANYAGLNPVGLSAQNVINEVRSLSAYSLGTNQKWADVTTSRLCNVTYTNTTLKPIMVQVYFYTTSSPLAGECTAVLSLSGEPSITLYGSFGYGGFSSNNISFIVPPFWSYKVRMFQDGLTQWNELR